MLAFIIPLRSEKVSSDWTKVCRLLNRTLTSICNQSNTEFMVFVACHEFPKTDYEEDKRVQFLKVNFSSPVLKNESNDRWIKEADKGKKINFAINKAISQGVSYVMIVDSDDCISNKICDFVHKNSDESILGWYSKKGYIYPEGKSYSYLNVKNFHTLCGSSVIIKPQYIHHMYEENFFFNHGLTTFNNGTSLKPLPFPGAVYSILNGTNHVMNLHGVKERNKIDIFSLKFIKTLLRRLGKYVLVPKAFIRKEFSL